MYTKLIRIKRLRDAGGNNKEKGYIQYMLQNTKIKC